jgi:hypothetical protein
MKNQGNWVFYVSGDKFRPRRKKTQNNDPSVKGTSFPDSFPATENPEKEGKILDKPTRRAIELNRRGIFACPRYARFFVDDEDEIRIY